ncbi:MAG: serine/threonine protein kinase [Coriobacteriales bacterium]|jgi:hypothetical protein|nr:serine/threonine protein kinase [Coriobacteriales bacterium]
MVRPLILNRYRLLETKGRGGFGTVDVAWDSRLQRRVAIKRILLASDETDLVGIQEARTAALLNDARIVNVLDFEVTGSEALIIMEYVDGPTLSMLLKESRSLLDLDTIATLVADVAAALEYAHENQVLHLDITPDNILIDHKGHIKVTDFGLAELSGTVGFAEPQGGTVGYMPPEQLTQEDVDVRTDLWALAILLYQLLTGKNPFLTKSADASLERILNDPLPLPSALRPELDLALDEPIIKALMADKWQRFDSIAPFLAEISPLLGNPQSGRRKLKRRVNERELDEVAFTDEWHQADVDEGEANGAAGKKRGANGGESESAGRAGRAGRDKNEGGRGGSDVRGGYDDYGGYGGGYGDDALIKPTLWERVPGRVRGMLGRLLAALACGSFTFTGLSGFEQLAKSPTLTPTNTFSQLAELPQSNLALTILIGLIALVALAGLLAPRLGSALACIALVAGIIARGSPLVGIALGASLIIWWLFFGRKGGVDSTVVMLTPLLGALWLGFALPLLAGLLLPWKRAVAATVAQGLLLITLATLTDTGHITSTGLLLLPQDGIIPSSLLATFSLPLTWATLVAFILSSLVLALLASRGTIGSATAGTVCAALVIAAFCIAAPLLINPGVPLTTIVADTASLALSFILVLIVSLSGVSADALQPEEV